MPKLVGDKLVRVHLQLYENDWNDLGVFFGGSTKRSAVVRDVIRDFVKHTKAKAAQQARHIGHISTTGTEKDGRTDNKSTG